MVYSLTDDDIAYLTIHIGGFLKYTPSSQKNMKKFISFVMKVLRFRDFAETMQTLFSK